MTRREAPEWEVIPSISLAAGQAVAEVLGTPNFIIDIDVEAAQTALTDMQDKKAKPGIVHFCLEKEIVNMGREDQITLGTAQFNEDKSTTVKESLINTTDVTPRLLTHARLQTNAVHELKHAADFTVRSLRRADHRFYKKAVRQFEAKITKACRTSDYILTNTLNQSQETNGLNDVDLQIEQATNEFIRKMSKESPLEKRIKGIDPKKYGQIVKIVRKSSIQKPN